MPSIYVLYINDDIFGPSLELIKRVCDPYSFSMPHISVRGPIRNFNKNIDYLLSKRFGEVNLKRIGDFFNFGLKIQNTVFVECDSTDFDDVYQKPDFILSPPHITLYDGSSRLYAKRLKESISLLDWRFNIKLKKEYNYDTKNYEFPKLSKVEIGVKRKRDIKRKYSNEATKLFLYLFDQELTMEYLESLPDSKRIDYIKKIHSFLQKESGLKKHFPVIQNISINEQYSREKKIALGQFPTPPELANEIVSYISKYVSNKIDFGDPSIGTGTFFYCINNFYKNDQISSAIGFEVDPEIAKSTKSKWSNKGLDLRQSNFLISDLDHIKKRNLIISNPPYVRHHYIDKNLKNEYNKRIKILLNLNVSGLAGLYIYFILLSDNWLSDNGLAVWLIPSEFMETNYGKILRTYLVDYVSLISVHRYNPNDLQFDSATVTSCLIIYKKKKPDNIRKVTFTTGGTLIKPESIEEVNINDLRSSDKWPYDIKIISLKKQIKIKLGDLFEIKRGIATGANKIFIIKYEDCIKYGIPDSCIKPILPNPKNLNNNIIECDKNGWPILKNKLVLIDCNVPEFLLNKMCPGLYNYFVLTNAKIIKERYIIKNRKLWYQQEYRDPPPFLCTYFGRKNEKTGPFKFIFNKSIAVANNAYILLYPKGILLSYIEKNKKSYLNIYNGLNTLNSEVLEGNSRIYGGGLYKIEPKDLKNVDASNFLNIL